MVDIRPGGKFQVGDKVRPKDWRNVPRERINERERALRTREVLGVWGEYLWLTAANGGALTKMASQYEVVPNFFEEGKRYRSKINPAVTFEVLVVRENPGGVRVAFGEYWGARAQWQTISYDSADEFPWEEA